MPDHSTDPEKAACYCLRRPAGAAEWQVYHDIRRDVMLESREFSRKLPTEAEELAPARYPLLLWLGEVPIGSIRIDDLGDGAAAFRLVAIDPVRQGQGHGRAMLDQAEHFARGLGCRQAVVYATQESAGFYECSGYAEEDWDEQAMAGIVQMVKPL
jgi:GNAT superfamily N-acetyltransferase